MKFRENVEKYPVNYLAEAYTEVVLQLHRKELLGHKDPESLRVLSLVNDVYHKFHDEGLKFYDTFIGDINKPEDVKRTFKIAGIESDEDNYYSNKLSYSDYVFCTGILEDYMEYGFSNAMFHAFKNANKFEKKLLSDIIVIRRNPNDEYALKRVFNALFYDNRVPYFYELLTPALNAGKLDQYLREINTEPFINHDYIIDLVAEHENIPGYDISFSDELTDLIEKCEKSPVYSIFNIVLPVVKIDEEYVALSDVLNKFTDMNIILERDDDSIETSLTQMDLEITTDDVLYSLGLEKERAIEKEIDR